MSLKLRKKYAKPSLQPSISKPGPSAASLISAAFITLLISVLVASGFTFALQISAVLSPASVCYFSAFFFVLGLVLTHVNHRLLLTLLSGISTRRRYHRSHIYHMRQDRFQRLLCKSESRNNAEKISLRLADYPSSDSELTRSEIMISIHGLMSSSIFIACDSESTIADLLDYICYLQSSQLVNGYLVFPPFSLAPLLENMVLSEIGVGANSTLHFRLRVLGGIKRTRRSKQLLSDSEELSSSDELPGPSKRAKGKAKAQEIDNSLQVSPRQSVEEVIFIETAPECWPIPRDGDRTVAYVLDLSNTPEYLCKGQKALTMDAFIKQECQDSLSGPVGSVMKSINVPLLDPTGDGVECRRSSLSCNGCFTCSAADVDLLDGFERWSPGDQTEDDLFLSRTFEANNREQSSVFSRAAAFYNSVIKTCCTVAIDGLPCGGHAILRKYTLGPQNGCDYFVGCSNWEPSHTEVNIRHRFRKIPVGIRILTLICLFKQLPMEVDDESDSDVEGDLSRPCTQIMHPRHLPQKKECKFTHFNAEKSLIHGVFEPQKCHAKLAIFVPIDPTDLRAVIVPKGGVAHNHPTFPRMKVPCAVQMKYANAVEIFGPVAATTLRVDKVASTHSLLGGKLPQELHESMINDRVRRNIIKGVKHESAPSGFDLGGVLHQFKLEQQGSLAERYIQSVNTQADGMYVIITMNPQLAPFLHKARWIMVDTTFKIFHGKTNEWKLVIWVGEFNKRVVIGRVWSNRATRGAFQLVWDGIFDAVKVLTGKELVFRLFSKSSELMGAIGDAEGAQAQVLGDTVISRRMNNPTVSKMLSFDSDEILQSIWKTCLVHYSRGILNISDHISSEDQDYLRRFPYLELGDIPEFYKFCDNHKNKKIQDWWKHKKSYPWLLPLYNRSLTQMKKKYWDLMPADTNPIEGSHAQDNQVMSTNHPILHAILLAKQYDNDNARILLASMQSGILSKRDNTQEDLFKAQGRRQESMNRKRRAAAEISAEEELLSSQVKDYQVKAKEAREQLKELKAGHKLSLSPTKLVLPKTPSPSKSNPAKRFASLAFGDSPANPVMIEDNNNDVFNVGSVSQTAPWLEFSLPGAPQSPQHVFDQTMPQTPCRPRSIWGVPHPEQYDLTPSRLNWDHIEENVAHIAKRMRIQEMQSQASLTPYKGDNDLLISDLLHSPSKNAHC